MGDVIIGVISAKNLNVADLLQFIHHTPKK